MKGLIMLTVVINALVQQEEMVTVITCFIMCLNSRTEFPRTGMCTTPNSSTNLNSVVQHHLAQHTPHSCGVYHIWFPSNQILVQLHLILDVRHKVWLVYRAFKH